MIFVFTILAFVGSSWALPRVYCPVPVEVNSFTKLKEYELYFKENRIQTIGPFATMTHVDQFIFEYEKFPRNLKRELIKNDATITLIDGKGVSDDPTFKDIQTYDGRNWDSVPGAGGAPFAAKAAKKYKKGLETYCKQASCSEEKLEQLREIQTEFPTRIVVNSLYKNHGSTNAVLHEFAHTLDSLYAANGASNSELWLNVTKATPGYEEFILKILGPYGINFPNEAFAELFAYYFACPESRAHMETETPELAEFFLKISQSKSFKEIFH
jgi:hypothetical protein